MENKQEKLKNYFDMHNQNLITRDSKYLKYKSSISI